MARNDMTVYKIQFGTMNCKVLLTMCSLVKRMMDKWIISMSIDNVHCVKVNLSIWVAKLQKNRKQVYWSEDDVYFCTGLFNLLVLLLVLLKKKNSK